jgi:hypothetical protein
MNLALLTAKAWIEIALVTAVCGLGWWTYHTIYKNGAESVQVKWDAEKRDQAEQSLKITTDALATTRAVQATADKIQENANGQIKTLNTTVAAAVAGLRDRTPRPGNDNLPKNSTAGAATTGCNGSGLYREDSGFLIGEAATAAQLRIGLKACYAKYNAAREALK